MANHSRLQRQFSLRISKNMKNMCIGIIHGSRERPVTPKVEAAFDGHNKSSLARSIQYNTVVAERSCLRLQKLKIGGGGGGGYDARNDAVEEGDDVGFGERRCSLPPDQMKHCKIP